MKKLDKSVCFVGINSKYIHPAMGIYSLYANCEYEVDLLEFNIKDDIDTMYKKIEKYDVLFFSLYIWNVEIIKIILSRLQNKIINLGGPEASFNKNLLTMYPNNTIYITRGEGEESTNEFLDFLNGEINLSDVSNLYYVEPVYNEIYTTNIKLPDLTKIKSSLSLIKDYENRVCYVESSRGCFYSCTYCLASTEKPVRYFPLEKIKDELLFLLQNNAKTIKFLDRSFCVKVDFANRILNFIKKYDNGVSTFQFEINADTLDESTLEILKSMRKGMIRLEVGVQSTNQISLKAINRTQNFKKLSENIKALKENCVIHTDLIAGLPYETYESFRNSFNDVFMLFTDELQLGFLKELKGTVLSKTKSLYGYKFMEDAPFEVLSNDYITTKELQKIKKVETGVNRFYNYRSFDRTMNYIFNKHHLNPFDTFYNLTVYLEKTKPVYEYQFDEIAKGLFEYLSKKIKSKDELLFVLKEDYLLKNSIKPKIWWEKDITREERLKVYNIFKEKFDLNIDELYRYGQLEKNNNHYLLVNYKSKKFYKLDI